MIALAASITELPMVVVKGSVTMRWKLESVESLTERVFRLKSVSRRRFSLRGNNHEIRHRSHTCVLRLLVHFIGDCCCFWDFAELGVIMNYYKELVERLRKTVPGYDLKRPIEWEAADAIENLLNDIHARKAVAEGLMYLNGQLAKANAEKAEKNYHLEAENRRLENENFWLCKG